MSKRKYERANVIWLNESDKLESNVIYLLTFNDNGKEMYYVGRTTMRLSRRISIHSSINPTHKYFISNAISEFKHFTVSILCRCMNNVELKTKEEYYTLQYRSNEREFGYNDQIGDIQSENHRRKNGEGVKKHCELYGCSNKGKPSPMRGKKCTESHIRNNSLSKIEYYKTHVNVNKGRKFDKHYNIKCKSIPDNLIFDSIKQCVEYYTRLYGSFNILFYLDRDKKHKKSGQTFVRIKD